MSIAKFLLNAAKRGGDRLGITKSAFVGMPGGAPMDPAAGGAPMDPSMMGGGGMPPMDPSMMGGGGMPPMDPSMMGGGGMPPMDPSMMGGAPAGAPPPAGGGALPPEITSAITQAVQQAMGGAGGAAAGGAAGGAAAGQNATQAALLAGKKVDAAAVEMQTIKQLLMQVLGALAKGKDPSSVLSQFEGQEGGLNPQVGGGNAPEPMMPPKTSAFNGANLTAMDTAALHHLISRGLI